MSNKRGTKKHMAPLGQDFFALGASPSATTSQGKLPAKRSTEPFQSPMSSMSPKRPKLNSPMSQSMAGTSAQPVSVIMQQQQQQQSSSPTTTSKIRSWEEKAIIVPVLELKDKILQYDSESYSEEMIDRLLCGAVQQLREQKTKPDGCLVFTLLYLAKIRPLFFCSNIIVEAFSSLLRREHLIHFKNNKNNNVPVLIINLFYHAFHDENSWPVTFIKLYVEDSLGDRIWVDNENCKGFVDIIVASFHTKIPKNLFTSSDVSNPNTKHDSSSIASIIGTSLNSEDSVGEESSSSTASFGYGELGKDLSTNNQPITSRYLENENEIINYVFEVINDNLNRRPTVNDMSRNMVKLLIATAGVPKVRLLVAQKLESLFQNVKLSRPAQDLLSTVFLNCDDKDIETLNYLLKMRMKNKPFISHFINCFKELLNQNNGTFEILLRILLSNELSGIRHINNIHLISIMFQQDSKSATAIMARFYFSMIYSKDEHLRILRALLRDVVRTMKSEPLNFQLFVASLINECKRFMMSGQETFDYSLKDKVLIEVSDLVTMAIFLSANQSVRESYARPERKEIMRNFQSRISAIQCDTIAWIWSMVDYHRTPLFDDMESFTRIIKKILLLEPIEFYCKIDNWPSENERINVMRLTSEAIPLLEETVKCILFMAFEPKAPMNKQDACDIIWTLIHHATINFDGDFKYPVLLFRDLVIIEYLFKCCLYIYPENTTFRPDYIIPKFARIDLYWKVWIMMVIVSAHLPSTFGDHCWKNFPTFQALVEMAITNNFQFPPKSMDSDDMQNKMLQYCQLEKLNILEFENFLARENEINETNSFLLPTLITYDLTGIPRRPPNQFLNDYKQLCTNNPNYRLCHLLCQSRQPDFLLMIIDKQQNHPGSQVYLSSLNWLTDLVESYENNYGLLPVQCLCEYLLKQIAEETSSTNMSEGTKLEKAKRKEKRRKLVKLIDYFQNNIQELSTTNQLSPAFQYLIRHLSHARSMTRIFAYKAIHSIISINVEAYMNKLEESTTLPLLFVEESSDDWFHSNLVKYFRSSEQIQQICLALNAALSVESNPQLICEYLEFIAQHVGQPSEMLVFKCSALLIERRKIPMHIICYSDKKLKDKFLNSLHKIYLDYLMYRLDVSSKPVPIDQLPIMNYVYLRLNDSLSPIYINTYIIYAIILSLSFVDNETITLGIQQKQQKPIDHLANLFLKDPQYPQIFSDKEMKQLGTLIPDWLALRLLCSNVIPIISLVMANIKTENFIYFLDAYGLSMNAVQRILQALDKLTASETRAVKILNFDRQKLLNTFQTYWSMNMTHGYRFAKAHLNYKSDMDDDKDVDMKDDSSDKKSQKSSDTKTEPFTKSDIVNIVSTGQVHKLSLLTRQLATELNDSSIKTKKMTRLFLGLFADHVYSLGEHIHDGRFNSIFNVIIILVLKDSKHFGLNQELTSIKRNLQNLEVKGRCPIERTLFWKCFERFQYKENQKSKKSKTQKKKQSASATSAKSMRQLEDFLDKNKNKSGGQGNPWLDTYMDLAIEKYHKKDTDSENFNEDLQTLIFSRDRPYFLSLLLHKSNFSTLNNCIKFILDTKSKLNPTAVLDFLTICIDSPKLWIGRENDSQKVIKHEDVLNLNYDQIKKLIDYVIMENDIAKRIDLIMRTCCINNNKTEVVIHFLKDYKNESMKKISLELYARLYLQIPNVEINLKMCDEHVALIQSLPCFIDKITHNLITSFMFVEPNAAGATTAFQQNLIYWEYAMLMVATKHPLLFVRQLPMMPALLRGKVNVVNYDVFKNLNLLRIFSKLLNILNITELRQCLWNKNVKGVEQILNLYMDMFMSYYHLPANRPDPVNHELLPLILQFLRLIDDWTKHDPQLSYQWINKHRNDFTELSQAYNKEEKLFKSIENMFKEMPLNDETQLVIAGQHYQTLKRNLKLPKLAFDVLCSTLTEINKLIDKYPLLGQDFLNNIQTYYTNPFFCCLSFNITLKILKTNPNLTSSIVGSYIRCLQHESPVVNGNALDKLPKLILLAQDYRYLLLRKVFEMATNGNMDAMPALTEAFRALNTQIGC